MQAPSGHVPPSYHLSEILPSVQISRRSARNCRRSRLYTISPVVVDEKLGTKQG